LQNSAPEWFANSPPVAVDNPLPPSASILGEFPHASTVSNTLGVVDIAQFKSASGYKCDWVNCAKSFRRACDFRRHLKIHYGRHTPCPVIGCHRTYDRRDKVDSHLKGGHKHLDEDARARLVAKWQLSDSAMMPGLGF
jgi:hypothetical protein